MEFLPDLEQLDGPAELFSEAATSDARPAGRVARPPRGGVVKLYVTGRSISIIPKQTRQLSSEAVPSRSSQSAPVRVLRGSGVGDLDATTHITCPILLTKRGGRRGIADLESDVRSRMTPLRDTTRGLGLRQRRASEDYGSTLRTCRPGHRAMLGGPIEHSSTYTSWTTASEWRRGSARSTT